MGAAVNDKGGLFGLAGTIGAAALMGPFGAAGAGAGGTLARGAGSGWTH